MPGLEHKKITRRDLESLFGEVVLEILDGFHAQPACHRADSLAWLSGGGDDSADGGLLQVRVRCLIGWR